MEPNDHHILDGKKTKAVAFDEWLAHGALNNITRVARTELPDGVVVSTIFLGTPYSIFETMILGGEYDERKIKYPTWEEAEAGHQKAIELIFSV